MSTSRYAFRDLAMNPPLTPCGVCFPAGAFSNSLAVSQYLLVLLFTGWFACSYVDPAGVASLALFHFRLSPLHSRPPPKGSPFASCWRFPTGAFRSRRLPCASCPRMDCELGFRSNHLRSRPPPQGVPCAQCWWFPAGAHRLGWFPCASFRVWIENLWPLGRRESGTGMLPCVCCLRA